MNINSLVYKITFNRLPVEIENTIWSYLSIKDKYPCTRVLKWMDKRSLPELKPSKFAICDNEKDLLVNFARAIYNTFLDDKLNVRPYDDNQNNFQQETKLPSACIDRDILPERWTTYDRYLHPICDEITEIIKTCLFDDIIMVNEKPIVRKNIYIDEINKDKCTPDALFKLIHYLTNLRAGSKLTSVLKFNNRMDERIYKITILYRIVMKKFCKLRDANKVALAQQIALEKKERLAALKAEREAAKKIAKEALLREKLQLREEEKQEKLRAKEAAKQQKLRAKEEEKQQKLRAKEEEKQQKLRAKEEEKQQKLRAKQELMAMKQADKEAKKIRV